MAEELNFKVDTATRIRKSLDQVYEAVVAPSHLNKYFTNNSSGRLEPGATVEWKFSDLPTPLPVEVVECEKNKRLKFRWEAHKVGYQTTVEVFFEDLGEKGTMVRILESGWKPNAVALESLSSHTEGWVHMLCCMKGYMEFGIDLRNGSGACNQN